MTAVLPSGTTVRLRRDVEKFFFGVGGVSHASLGTVLDNIQSHSVDVTVVFFPEHQQWVGLKSELELVPESEIVQVGDSVRLRGNTRRPRYNWGKVTKHSVGVVRSKPSLGVLVVDFEEQKGWKGLSCELERIFGDESKSGHEECKGTVAMATAKAKISPVTELDTQVDMNCSGADKRNILSRLMDFFRALTAKRDGCSHPERIPLLEYA